MTQKLPRQLYFKTPEETAQFARRLAPLMGPGDVILLEGGIGVGKTHFARALIQERLARLNQIEDVPSPTFTLVQTYDDGACDIWHADLYRLTDAAEVEELGLIDAFETAICLVEWPDRLGTLRPASALQISLSLPDDPQLHECRQVELSGQTDIWMPRLGKVLS